MSYENKEYILQFFEGVHEEENGAELIEVYRKAKAFDEIIHAINICSQPRQSGRRYIDKFEFTKKAENIIEKYESGESDE